MMDNNVWTVVDLPLGKKVVGSKWVFRLKKNPDESIEHLKARVVAKGYTHRRLALTSQKHLPLL